MRKVKFLQDYGEYKRGMVINMDRQEALKLMTAGIVTYYFMRKL